MKLKPLTLLLTFLLMACGGSQMNYESVIIGHRGGIAAHQENTLEAFQHAIDTGISMIEFDLRQTADKKIICFHDEQIPQGKISNLNYNEILSYASNEGFYIPTFREVLELCEGKIKLDIEIKEPGYEQQVIEIVNQYFSQDEYLITSFHDEVIQAVKEINPAITCGLLLGKKDAGMGVRLSEIYFRKRYIQSGANFIAAHYKLAPLILRRAERNNIPVAFWTVNQTNLILKFLDDPRVMGIITDHPQTALELEK